MKLASSPIGYLTDRPHTWRGGLRHRASPRSLCGVVRPHLHPTSVLIRVDDLTDPQVLALLAEHLAGMHAVTPEEHVHALDVSALRSPDITLWTAWDGPV